LSQLQSAEPGDASGVADHGTVARDRSGLRGPTKLLQVAVDIAAVVLFSAEFVLLFAGAVSRYWFHRPLVWADELSITLLLWLAMLGAAVAMRRDEHLQLTFTLEKLSRLWQARMRSAVTCILFAFVACLLVPVIAYVDDEWTNLTPALGLPVSVRTAAMPVGFGLIFVELLARLLRDGQWRRIAASCGALTLVLLAFWAGQPLILAIGNYNLVVYFVVLLIALIFMGVPIGFSFGGATFLYLISTTEVPLTIVANRIAEGMSDPILLAIPMFVFLGSLIAMSGMARALVEFLITLVGHLKGGLSFVLLGGMYLVSGISGSKAADMAAISPVLLPEMERRGARRPELVALLAASGAMSETIPPSIVLIAVGAVTGVSIKALFAAGFIPAAICALTLMVIVLFRTRRSAEIPLKRATSSQIAKALWIALPALALPILIRYLVVNGITTATEVSVFGIAYTLLLGQLLYRKLEWAKLYEAALAASSLSGAILLILGFATAMAWALTQSGFSDQLNTLFHEMASDRIAFLAISILVFIVLGSFLEGIPAIVLLGPVMFPIAQGFAIVEVHYAMIVILAMGIGLFAPPFGIGFYYACAIGGASPDQVMRRIWSYLAFVLVGLVVVAAVPWLSLGK